MTVNPFSPIRREHDSPEVFFLPENFKTLEQNSPTFVVGGRGTGKTTFLLALNWRQRLENESLQRELEKIGRCVFDRRYVGVYMKTPRTQLSLIDSWLAPDDNLYAAMTGLHLSLLWSELLLDATLSLAAQGRVEIDLVGSNEFAAGFLHRYSEYQSFIRPMSPPDGRVTLASLSQMLRNVRRALESAALLKITREAAIGLFPVERPGELAQQLASGLSRLYQSEGGRSWTFRVCVDEAEHLSDQQQLVVNTIVRTCEAPLFPVVAYTAMPIAPEKTDSRLTLGRADAEIVNLEMRGSAFRSFVEGVTAARLTEYAGRPHSFNLTDALGPELLNGILVHTLDNSEGQRSDEILEAAQSAMSDSVFGKRCEADPAPITETYILNKLGLERDEWPRAAKSTDLRKRNVAAFLSIFSELGIAPQYVSANVLLGLCDGCIRDYLWHMEALFDQTGVDVNDFASRSFDVDEQASAFATASEKKRRRLPVRVLAETSAAERLVDGIGMLTKALQAPTPADMESSRYRHLRVPERGIFVLVGPPSDETLTLLRSAIEGGYLTGFADSDQASFRLHSSLAPHFRITYRKPQYEVRLKAHELDLLICEDGARHVPTIAARLNGEAGQEESLF